MQPTERNWAGNQRYSSAVLRPATVTEVQSAVVGATKVRALGSRHSFNDIADSDDTIIAMSALDRIVSLDVEQRTVTIEGGVRYAQLGQYLAERGFALHNMASLPHISVAGACATATHGSGEGNGNLATAVRAMEIVTADGSIRSVSRETDGERFDGMVVALGALGIVVRLTLDVVPAFDVSQDVYEGLDLARLDEFDAIQSSAYSVSLFTDWREPRFTQVWLKRTARHADPGAEFHGARRASVGMHPIAGHSAESCTAQLGASGASHERLPHFRMDFTPSSGAELQSEYFVPREHGVAALHAVMSLGGRISPHLLVSEVRTIAADSLWMSPCYRQPCVAIHFTWKQDWAAVSGVLGEIESVLEPFDARPHWGKLFTMPASRIQSLYSRMSDFRRLLAEHDPAGRFSNAFIDRYIHES